MLRKLVVLFFITLPILSFADEPTLNKNTRSLSGVEVPKISLQEIKTQESKRVGKVEFRKWFFHIYNAELYTENGKFSWDKPFLLKIHYLLSFKSRVITNRTIREIAEQHPEAVRKNKKKYKQMIASVIPDIKKNSNLYGYMDKDGYGYIFTDQNLVGKINDKQLSKYFFEIWLSDNTANHQLSTKLRGLS
ncbi:chalcone isomerase family protein [Francisella adeliensis]|uniref:Chalcone isomerase domain-containing protein n=1 Tax=Francisella adeliensis TaxID=2007306 RepID=A0A2Z4Y0J2_9GAMM|nr:chalcone isomerase family protein [Francisella adeliensis]AXA34396.1 hypothetical protein CDH04_08300 [Francisella adeliensis]MBK2086487.1 chalcone isomerase family protein [Francisella adeliensis]MBK2096115.1 chalcone isomerase family protein [Francisella adeliensis]QIW12642.1 hypothetical protein FZC43_08305 [Francisella adeliensis]QIW14516.1 hypothetical protein FZC44_08300 [Francisella adeliensis]